MVVSGSVTAWRTGVRFPPAPRALDPDRALLELTVSHPRTEQLHAAYSRHMGWDRESLRRAFGSQRMWRVWAAMVVLSAFLAFRWAIAALSDTGTTRSVDVALAVIMTIGTVIWAFAAVMLFREGRRPDPR